MLNMISNSQTFSKYLSRVSTKLWMNSKKLNSFYRKRIIEVKKWWFTYDVFIIIHANNEVQGGVSAVDYLVLSMVQEAALIFRTTQAFSYQFTFEGHSLSHGKLVKVLR